MNSFRRYALLLGSMWGLSAASASPPVGDGLPVAIQSGQNAHAELNGLKPKPDAFQSGRPLQPRVIRSEKDALQHLTADSAAKLSGQVDFAKQTVILFAWKGSGQDRLKVATANQHTVFSLEAGRTEDLREQARAYRLDKSARWSVHIPWEEVKTLILKDRVIHAMQLHNLKVTVGTKEGVDYQSIEPGIDVIIRFIRDNKKDIPIATE